MSEILEYLGYFLALFTDTIGSVIDASFSNNLGLDELNAVATYGVFSWLIYVVIKTGGYYYRIKKEYVLNCILIDALLGVVCSITMLAGNKIIPMLFAITDGQREIMSLVLSIESFTLILRSLSIGAKNYLLCHGKTKLVNIGSVIYYVSVALADLASVKMGYGIKGIFIGSFICEALYLVYIYKVSNILKKEKFYWNKAWFLEAASHCKNILSERVMGKIVTLTSLMVFSRFDNYKYAIFNVLYGVVVKLECISNALYWVSMDKFFKDRQYKYKDIFKKYIFLEYVIGISLSILFVFMLHGDVLIKDLIVYLPLWCGPYVFILSFYEIGRSWLSSQMKTKDLIYASFVAIIRIVMSVTAVYIDSVMLAGLAFSVDFMARGVYFYLVRAKYEKIVI